MDSLGGIVRGIFHAKNQGLPQCPLHVVDGEQSKNRNGEKREHPKRSKKFPPEASKWHVLDSNGNDLQTNDFFVSTSSHRGIEGIGFVLFLYFVKGDN